jgi:hypothetical protein
MTNNYADAFSWGLPGLSWIQVALLLIGAGKLLSLFVWPSIRNLPFVTSVPFVGIAVGWGAFYWTRHYLAEQGLSQGTVEAFITILSIGAAVTCLSAVATTRALATPRGHAAFNGLLVDSVDRGAGVLLFVAALVFLAGASIAIGAFYALSGVVPAFADNPLLAKYFAGEYTARAAPYMALFRGGLVLYQIGAMVGILLLPGRLNVGRILLVLLLIMLLAATLLAVLSLRRGVAAQPILDALLILLAVRARLIWLLIGIVVYLLVFAFGSAVNDILLYILGIKDTIGLDAIIGGLSDVHDIWWFMEAYHRAGPPHSLGMTVFGGLVPYDFRWNPGNYTKWIIGADLNTGSGGFRLPMSVWGYDAFGYAGLVLWSAVDGFAIVVQAFVFRLIAQKGGDRYVLAVNVITYQLITLVGRNLLQWWIDDAMAVVLLLMLRLVPVAIQRAGRRRETTEPQTNPRV